MRLYDDDINRSNISTAEVSRGSMMERWQAESPSPVGARHSPIFCITSTKWVSFHHSSNLGSCQAWVALQLVADVRQDRIGIEFYRIGQLGGTQFWKNEAVFDPWHPFAFATGFRQPFWWRIRQPGTRTTRWNWGSQARNYSLNLQYCGKLWGTLNSLALI